MAFFETHELPVAHALTQLVRANPFTADRVTAERAVLGPAFAPSQPVWSSGEDLDNPNAERVAMVAQEHGERWRRRALTHPLPDDERALVREVCTFALYERTQSALVDEVLSSDSVGKVGYWPAFVKDHQRVLVEPGLADVPAAHLFACFLQVRRAYNAIFHTLSGGSSTAAGLRAAAWRSLFGVDPSRYRRFLYRALPDVPTLITGPTGTGKELVAQAIGGSGYIPFDPERQRFVAAPTFRALHLAAVPAGLVESELFGHRKGSFTGAIADHAGWLAELPPGAAVFLDEIGELDPVVQVKLLRVLEERRFWPVGSREPSRFDGKIIAATHVDLEVAIDEGRFRRDLFYRLCGDRVRTPSLRERLDDDPGELRQITRSLLARMVPAEALSEVLPDVLAIVARDRGPAWPWPGNVRELAQAVRQALVHGASDPGTRTPTAPDGDLTLAEVQRRHAREVLRRAGNYRAAAVILDVDWRTVRSLAGERASD
jgi:hypothetical protein